MWICCCMRFVVARHADAFADTFLSSAAWTGSPKLCGRRPVARLSGSARLAAAGHLPVCLTPALRQDGLPACASSSLVLYGRHLFHLSQTILTLFLPRTFLHRLFCERFFCWLNGR